MTNTAVERNRIAVFVAFALGIAVAVGGVLFATGGLRGSPEVGGVTLSSLLLPTAYMFSPAVANVATRLLTDEGWTNLRLQTNVSMEWGWYMIAWLGTSALIGVGFWLYTAVGEAGLVPAAPVGSGVGTATLIVSLTLGPAINTLVAVGEEFGWRAYLLPKLEPLGIRRALIAHGTVWGIWHWPLIAMGYNYGFDYPLAPWSGLATMTIATIAIGTIFGALSMRTGSVWPAALAHGTLNAVGSLSSVVSGVGLAGAAPVGLIGVVPWVAAAGVVLVLADGQLTVLEP
jgi:membrane protease YdiL (CAAX protease family)